MSCPHCLAGEPRVWDDMLFHYAHPAGDKLKTCHDPWRERPRHGALRSIGVDDDTLQRDIILRNVARDPHYAPYCLRCKGLIRMSLVEAYYWRCGCGAQCDYRQPEEP